MERLASTLVDKSAATAVGIACTYYMWYLSTLYVHTEPSPPYKLAGRRMAVDREFVYILFICMQSCDLFLYSGSLTSFYLLGTTSVPFGGIWGTLEPF